MSALDANGRTAFFTSQLSAVDPDVAAAIGAELGRQRDEIELIASENIVSRAVLEAQGSVMTNKYAEGYPGRRYYGGCQHVDVVENLAIERAELQIEHACVRRVDQTKADNATGGQIEGGEGRPVHGHPVSQPASVTELHHTAQGLFVDRAFLGQAPVIQNERKISVEARRVPFLDDKRSIKPARHLLPGARVRMIPIGPRIRRVKT